MASIEGLTAWYHAQCNGDWEHSFGVTIQTLDNPGWLLTVDLEDTALETKEFLKVARGDSEFDGSWTTCEVKGNKFVGAGGTGQLAELIDTFLGWSGA